MPANQTEPRLSVLLHSRGNRLGLPISGNFELTSRCNFNCPMCYVHRSQDDACAAARELSAAEWIAIAREAKERGMVFALLTGGEPFVRRDFFEIYGAMKAMGLMVSINSNGSMLRGEILQRLIEDPPLRINISLYGGSGDTYRSMCGQDAFAQVVENIAALKKAGIDVRLNLSVTPYHRQDMERIYAIAGELDVTMKSASYMYPPIRLDGAYGQNDRLTPEEAARSQFAWDTLRFTPEEMELRVRGILSRTAALERECADEELTGMRCRAGCSTFWMTWDGRMLPCGMMTEPSVNVRELGFSAAWDQIRAAAARIRSPEACMRCSKREICAVCASVCYGETGAFDGKPEYMCRMTDELLRLCQQRSERANEDFEGIG